MLNKCFSAIFSLLMALLLAASGSAMAASGHTQLTWYGHSAFKIVTPQGRVLLLDPWITNPANPKGNEDLAGLHKADFIFITHGHSDHTGDSVAIAKSTGARLVTNYDLGNALIADLGFPAAQATAATMGNFGGTIELQGGEVSVTFVPAVHGSTIALPPKQGAAPQIEAGGNPGGFIIRIKDGPTFYVTGDTAVFSDMQLIPKFDHIDVMLACIGDHYTMGPRGAALATEYVRPDVVIPMHYGTSPVLTGTPKKFGEALKERHVPARLDVMQPNQTLTF